MFSLAKISLAKCTAKEQMMYKSMKTLPIEIKPCCTDIMTASVFRFTVVLDISNQSVVLPNTLEKAAFYGHVTCLQYVLRVRQQCTKRAAELAAANGHIECLRVMLDQKAFQMTNNLCARAAFGGHLQCLRFLRESGCPWDIWTTHNAVLGSHLNCLMYAAANGCCLHWTALFVSLTMNGENSEITNYLVENGCNSRIGYFL